MKDCFKHKQQKIYSERVVIYAEPTDSYIITAFAQNM